MLSPKNALGIFLYVNIVSWVLLLGIRLIAFLGFSNQSAYDVNFYLKGLLLNLFLLIIFFYFSSRYEKIKNTGFIEILISLFVLGLAMNTFSLVIQFVISILETPPVSYTTSNIINGLYHLNIGLVMIFLTQAFFYWKKMVLHERNEILIKTWNAFEYLLLISLLFNFFEFDISNIPFFVALSILLFIGLTLSINLKWIAYLSAKEKWQSILLLLFISVFAYYFFYTVISHSYDPYFTTDLMHSVYVLAMFVFVIFYTIFSLLVIIFNLPTSSVLEQKNEEIISFQRLALSLQSGENEDKVYEALLDNALKGVAADAAWLDIFDESGQHIATQVREIDLETVKVIKKHRDKKRRIGILNETFTILKKNNRHELNGSEEIAYESFLVTPLIMNQKSLGSLTLLKKINEGFDEQKQELVKTFVSQASISIENFRLISKTIEAERYKEELKIAQRIQQKLLPQNLQVHECLEIDAFSQSAYEVGGDYYDVHKISEEKIILIIGDVSGKGTNASFLMAQMKGIFQTLVHLNLEPHQFLNYANKALANTLERGSFITITVLFIDTVQKKVEIARAGHCPTLYYHALQNSSSFYKGSSIGLGLVKDDSYKAHIEILDIYYQPNDLILLFTDGITEAINVGKKDFGDKKLQKIIDDNHSKSCNQILKIIKEELDTFSKGMAIHDDHTALLIKFK